MPKSKVFIELVNRKGKVIDLKEKYTTHRIPVELHRAISIVIFNKDKAKMLITKRSSDKPTWPGFWSNAVCTHPLPGETYLKAAQRRLYEELGFKTVLKEVFRFCYEAKMDNRVWGENEYDVVFAGKYEGQICPNPVEVSGYEWVRLNDLKKDLNKNLNKYTPWFETIVKKFKF